MKFRSLPLVAALTIAAACGGRQAAVTSPAGTTAPQVATGGYVQAGTRLVTTLDTPVGTDVSKVGDSFYATVQTPIVDPAGATIVPVGSKIRGRVMDLQTTRGSEPAVVSLSVEAISINGVERPLSARVVEADAEATSRKASGRAALGGAAGGAVIGAILGGGSGALKGGAVGAGTGTLLSLGTSKTGAKLPPGTQMVIELTQAVPVAPAM